MSDRIRHADEQKSLNELIATTALHADNAAETNGNTLAILSSSYRVVLKSGRLSGGRACALSARAAARGIQACVSKP
jgi:hypothetical protein